MHNKFIEHIHNNNTTPNGREKLYRELEKKEKACWDEIEKENIVNWSQLFSKKASQTPNKKVIIESDTNNSFTYQELEERSNKIRDFILTVKEYQIGLNYRNGFLFIAALLGINKAGKLAILFNNREPKERQEELAFKSNTKIVLGNPIEGLAHHHIEDIFVKDITTFNSSRYALDSSLDDSAFVIFTSGTSGPSKGALFSHRRMIGAGIAWSLRTAMDHEDNCYIPLPLYHGNALAVAFSSVIYSNATATIRVKFSVSSFFDDINRFRCSHMVYIGELWRYILNRYDTNVNKCLKVIFGNGLNKQLWEDVTKRFDIKHVVEHFGSTEMPAGALTNWFDIEGYCGYLPPHDPRLNEMVLVDENYGSVPYGKYGQALFLVPSGNYKGYLDSSLDESKLFRDLFKQGDLWWKSGDLLLSHENGFYTFVERLGDTYRYKGENVACVDVEEAIRQSGDFTEVVVYGITLANLDGKIGMASLRCDHLFDPNTILDKLKEKLANYAMPYFIKIQEVRHQTTSTLKIQKTQIAKEGIENYKRYEHFVLIENSYRKIDEKLYTKIKNGKITL